MELLSDTGLGTCLVITLGCLAIWQATRRNK